MQSIQLKVQDSTPGGVTHVNLLINGKDTGALYLDTSELELLNAALAAASRDLGDDVLQVEEAVPDVEVDLDIFE